MTWLQIAGTLGSLAALIAAAWNAWSRVQLQLEIMRLRAEWNEKFAQHVLEQTDTFSAIRLELSQNYVSHASLDKAIGDFTRLVDQLGGQIRTLQRVVDRYIPRQRAMEGTD